MRVIIQGDSQARDRCYECNKKVKFGQHYIIKATFPKGRQDLKMDYKLRLFHYLNCDNPREGFGDDGMGKSYLV